MDLDTVMEDAPSNTDPSTTEQAPDQGQGQGQPQYQAPLHGAEHPPERVVAGCYTVCLIAGHSIEAHAAAIGRADLIPAHIASRLTIFRPQEAYVSRSVDDNFLRDIRSDPKVDFVERSLTATLF